MNLLGPAAQHSNLGPAENLPQMSQEQQIIAIEANRLLTQQQVEEGTMPPLPPTELTPADAKAYGGAPLIAPPTPAAPPAP